MTQYPIHTITSAPAASVPLLEQIAKKFGFIPNLAGVLADAPAVLEGYFSLAAIFDKTSLSPAERQIVLLATSFENGCEYCVAAHTVIARTQSVSEEVVDAIRKGDRIPDPKLEALRRLTTVIVRNRGVLFPEDVLPFFDAGYSRAQILEVIAGVAMKTISNYANHVSGTPVDDTFASAAWSDTR